LIPNLRYRSLSVQMRKLILSGPGSAFSAIVYRYVSRKYAATREIMSGAGSFKAGGRWNFPNTYHAVYCASTADLANREYFASCRIAGIPEYTRMPLVGMAIEVNLAQVLDLRAPAILDRLGASPDLLNEDKWREKTDAGMESLCQAIGRAAKDVGFEAVLAPSAQATNQDDYNIVLIIENARPGSKKWRVLKGDRNSRNVK